MPCRNVYRLIGVMLLMVSLLVSVDTSPGGSDAQAASPWKRVYTENFNGSKIPRRWSAYTGRPSSDPWTWWTSANVRVATGKLVLSGTPWAHDRRYWTTGAVSSWRTARRYGRWTIRFRATRSTVLSHHFLLWPKSEKWPPEVDILESFDGARRGADAFVHYRTASGVQKRARKAVKADFTRWNEVTLVWTPDRLEFRLNGKRWWTMKGAAVPSERMVLALQTETQLCDRTAQDCTVDGVAGVPRVEIDRVTIDAYRP